MRRKHRWLRFAAINTHSGIGIRNGIIQWVRKRHPGVKILFLSEVRNGGELRRNLPRRWATHPYEQPGEGVGKEGTTYLAYDTKRFTYLQGANFNITFGGKHVRRMVGAILFDCKLRRVVVVTSIHVAPLGRGLYNGSAGAVRQHVRQVGEHVAFHNEHWKPANSIHICGGDINELPDRDASHPGSAESQFREIGMKPTFRTASNRQGPNRMMVLFTDSRNSVRWHRSYDTGVKGMNHEVVVAGMKIRRNTDG